MDSELNKDDVEEKSVNEVASTSTAQSIPNESTKRRHEELEEDDDDEENAKEELRSYREAKALLGAADEENCSFSKGYAIRQALYACNTCKMNVDPETGEKYFAGICYACSDKCHDGHDLFELYTKRNFRCDCGNARFAETKCLLSEKSGFNETNNYNHNFKGLYCICNRPYPDQENLCDSLQCIMCEDWFHSNHLKNWSDLDFHEVICHSCVAKHRFLIYYYENGCIKADPRKVDASDSESDTEFEKMVTNYEMILKKSQESVNEKPTECKLVKYKSSYADKYSTYEIDDSKITSLSLSFSWRLELCKCASCLKMYSDLGLSFLIEISDMVANYCKNSMNTPTDTDTLFSSKFNELNRVHQIEVLDAFNFLKDEFKTFLSQFKGNVISVEDVNKFVETIRNKRQQVRIPYFCR